MVCLLLVACISLAACGSGNNGSGTLSGADVSGTDAPPRSDTPVSVSQPDLGNVPIYNETGLAAAELYIAYAGTYEWSVNALADEWPSGGDAMQMYLPSLSARYDIRMVTGSGEEYLFADIDFSEMEAASLILEDGQPAVQATATE